MSIADQLIFIYILFLPKVDYFSYLLLIENRNPIHGSQANIFPGPGEYAVLKEISNPFKLHPSKNPLQASPGWSQILSHLSLPDLDSFAQSHCKLSEIVDSYLSKENPLTIDMDTLCNHPIATHEYLYIRYGSRASNLIINGIPGVALRQLMRYFPNLRQLTLSHMTLEDVLCKGSCPFILRKLVLLNNKARGHESIHGLSRIPNLKSLYLRGNDRVLLDSLPRLQSLTVINQRLDFYALQCPALTSLTIDHCWRSLFYHNIQSLPRLEHFRVLGSVDWKQRQEIEALQVKHVHLDYYSEIPAQENLILRLNDDCLLHLARFLPADQWVSLHEMHPRLQHLPIPTFALNQKTLEDRPLRQHKEYYTRIGPLVSNLRVNRIADNVVRELMPLFTHLRELTLHMNRRVDIASCLPLGLRRLSLGGSMMDDGPLLRRIFRRLNPSLEVLSLSHPESMYYAPEIYRHTRGLEELKHIREFQCDFFRASGEFLYFLELNQDSLTVLHICTELIAAKGESLSVTESQETHNDCVR